MNLHPALLYILLLALALPGACAREERPAVYSDPAQLIRAAPGNKFQLALQSNQSTGYQWVLLDSAALSALRVVSTDYTIPRELRNRDGAGGKETWTFLALQPGESTLSLIYVRPWENTAPPDTTRFRVVIE